MSNLVTTASSLKYKFVPTNALLLFNILLRYNTLFQHVSIPSGIILGDTVGTVLTRDGALLFSLYTILLTFYSFVTMCCVTF
jgi:hypothetical protein